MSRYIDAKKMEEWVRKVYKDDPHIIPLLIRAIRFQMTADVREVKHLSPCDVCAYNPPSSGDGKPCSMCPAVKKEEE